MKKNLIAAVRGMHDILPDSIAGWEQLEKTVAHVMASYAYQQVRTPVLEREELFLRPVGEHSDIVQKELFRFAANDGTSYCMRPEATVATVRALASADLLRQPARVWYLGPMFRHERPQKGRLRQFHQFGAEILGVDDPLADIEVIQLCWRLWRELGIDQRLLLQLNNLGRPVERSEFRSSLTAFLTGHLDKLSELDQQRVTGNPLRVLDSKDPALEELLAEAPKLSDFIGQESQQHYEQVLTALDRVKIPYEQNPRLVRGLDYYNLTVFEWGDREVADRRQNAIAGGGRYDGLTELIGGDACAGAGMAAGMERILQLGTCADAPRATPTAFLATSRDALDLIDLHVIAEQLREAGITVHLHPRTGKIKDLFKHAANSGASHAVIIGPKEASSATATVKSLRQTDEQSTVPLAELVTQLRQLIALK